MPKKIDWDSVEKRMFEFYASGATLKAVALDAGVNYITVVHHFNKKGVMLRYSEFLKSKKYKKGDAAEKVTKKRVIPEIHPAPQNKAEQFKERLKIGDKVKNKPYMEQGVVIAKYPHIFTIRTTSGFISSYSYNSFAEFT